MKFLERTFWTLMFLTVPVIGVGFFVLAAFIPGGWLPPNISTIGQDVDHLFYVILAITGFFFVVTELLLVYSIFTAHGRANGKAQYTHGNRNLEIFWTLGTSAILIFVALYQIPSWAKAKYVSNFREANPNTKPTAMVIASQFLWETRYPTWDEANDRPREFDWRNPSFVQSFETYNELHVPPNETILLQLTTRDVIHSFWVPALRVKQDALPGNVIPIWFDAQKPGTYEWVCAELCGWGHYRMRAKLVVHDSKESYHAWLKEKTKEQTTTKRHLAQAANP